MKTFSNRLGLVTFALLVPFAGCSKKESHVFSSLKDRSTAGQLKQFVSVKRSQALSAADTPAPGIDEFFAAAEKGDWLTVSNRLGSLLRGAGSERSSGSRLAAVLEVDGALEAFSVGNEKYSALFGNEIVQSIPPGSIYFGGTDPGRFVVTAMQKSHVDGDPFFTLTQNALADGRYLDYLRAMYGGKIYIPTKEDSDLCFREYTTDAEQRSQKHQLKPGERIRHDATGHAQPYGQVAVMEVNGLICKVIFDKNPDREFYIEESFPLDWMYPYLEPHGVIFKLNRRPVTVLADDIVQRDADAWAKYTGEMIGNWLQHDTPVSKVAEFSEKVFLNHNLEGYGADPRFIENTYAHRMFAKERSSIAALYAWRVKHASSADEKQRMTDAADFAFRQAVALCPYSPESVYRYVAFLVDQKRISDALAIAETAAKFKIYQQTQFHDLVNQLKRSQPAK